MTLSQLASYFLRLGTVGFGGPIALCAQMKTDLVDRLRWFTHGEYEEGFAFSQSAPGPVAFQLAMYLGFVRFATKGATAVGLAFIAVPFALVLGLSYLYSRYGTLGLLESALIGISPAVVAVIIHAAFQLGESMLRDARRWLVALTALGLALFAGVDLSLIILGAGLLGLVYEMVRARGSAPLPLLLPVAFEAARFQETASQVLPQLGWFFFKAGALTFGSGYVVVAFIQNGVVDEYHWLSARQFLDGVAVGQITPGPVIITSTFVGYLVQGIWGALVSTLAVLLPVYLITIAGAPMIARYRSNPALQGFMSGANAAALGVIAGVAVKMTQNAVVDWKTGAIMIVSLAALWFRNVPSVFVLAGAGILGALLL